MNDADRYRRVELIFVVLFIVGAAVWAYFNTPKDVSPESVDLPNQTTIQNTPVSGFRLQSTAFTQDSRIPMIYTCEGQSIHPPLTIVEPPKDTKTFALILEDPDAPAGVFTHWIVWNIPPTTTDIAQGVVPQTAVVGTNGAGKTGYIGPCPPASPSQGGPAGTHRYFFRLYALDTEMGIDSKGTRKDLDAMMKSHILGETALMGRYAKQ